MVVIVETHDTFLQALSNSENINQTKLSYRIDTSLETITTSIQRFGEVVVESKPCELTFARTKDKQAQMMVADLSPPLHWLHCLVLQSIPSSDLLVTCQGEC
jgi:hypothetical protein